MSKSISNVLEIYRLVVLLNYTRAEAVSEVGKKTNIDHSTLLSCCTKDLNISADRFDYFLESKNNFNFKNFLFRRFPAQQDRIFKFFNTFEDTSDIPIIDLSKIMKPSPYYEKKRPRSRALLSSLKENILDWVSHPDVPQDIKEEMKGWIKKIDGQE